MEYILLTLNSGIDSSICRVGVGGRDTKCKLTSISIFLQCAADRYYAFLSCGYAAAHWRL